MAYLKVRCPNCGFMVIPRWHPKDVCQRFARVIELSKGDGLSFAKIGHHVGLSRERIRQIAKMAGLDPGRVRQRKYRELRQGKRAASA